MAKDKHVINVQFPNSVWPQVLEAVENASKKECPHCGSVSHNGSRFGVGTWIRELVYAELARLDGEKKKPGRKKKKKKGGWPKGKKRGPRKANQKDEPVVVSSLKEPKPEPAPVSTSFIDR